MGTEKPPLQGAKIRKGVILAGGSGTRLFPSTKSVNKHLLPIYDKPLIYYPLTTLMLAGVSQILIISTAEGVKTLQGVIGDGNRWGLTISYTTQNEPNGIAEGILLAADFIAGEPFALILGDNIFYGGEFSNILHNAVSYTDKQAIIFSYWVANPSAYGIIQVNADGDPISVEEKPENPISHRAITGLYFYDERAVDYARTLRPSARNELEITDLNRIYLEEGRLKPIHLGRGFIWFDAGTTHDMLLASQLVEIIQMRQRTGIAFPEEVAYRSGLIDFDAFSNLVDEMPKCAYRDYLDTLRLEIIEGVA